MRGEVAICASARGFRVRANGAPKLRSLMQPRKGPSPDPRNARSGGRRSLYRRCRMIGPAPPEDTRDLSQEQQSNRNRANRERRAEPVGHPKATRQQALAGRNDHHDKHDNGLEEQGRPATEPRGSPEFGLPQPAHSDLAGEHPGSRAFPRPRQQISVAQPSTPGKC